MSSESLQQIGPAKPEYEIVRRGPPRTRVQKQAQEAAQAERADEAKPEKETSSLQVASPASASAQIPANPNDQTAKEAPCATGAGEVLRLQIALKESEQTSQELRGELEKQKASSQRQESQIAALQARLKGTQALEAQLAELKATQGELIRTRVDLRAARQLVEKQEAQLATLRAAAEQSSKAAQSVQPAQQKLAGIVRQSTVVLLEEIDLREQLAEKAGALCKLQAAFDGQKRELQEAKRAQGDLQEQLLLQQARADAESDALESLRVKQMESVPTYVVNLRETVQVQGEAMEQQEEILRQLCEVLDCPVFQLKIRAQNAVQKLSVLQRQTQEQEAEIQQCSISIQRLLEQVALQARQLADKQKSLIEAPEIQEFVALLREKERTIAQLRKEAAERAGAQSQ